MNRLPESFLKHIAVVMDAMPYLDSSQFRPKVCNAYRLARKELKKLRTR